MEPFHNLSDLLGFIQPVFEVAQHRGCIWAAAPMIQPIVDPQALFSGIQKVCLLQNFKMLGSRGLGNLQSLLNLTDTQLAMLKHLDDLDPIGASKGLHHLNELS